MMVPTWAPDRPRKVAYSGTSRKLMPRTRFQTNELRKNGATFRNGTSSSIVVFKRGITE
jgi:hypothetical protein